MTTILEPPVPIWRRAAAALTGAGVFGAKMLGEVVRTRTRPSLKAVTDNFYDICGFGLFDAAMFVHSNFTGLMVTGISFIVFGWKVHEDDA